MGGFIGSRPRRRNGSVVWGRGGGLDLGAMWSVVTCCLGEHVVMCVFCKCLNDAMADGVIENASQSKLLSESIVNNIDAID